MGVQTRGDGWIKSNELKGAALDWAVAQVSGAELDIIDMPSGPYIGLKGRTPDGFPTHYSPSTMWGHGGPLIEEYGVRFLSHGDEYVAIPKKGDGNVYSAPGHLTSAMRAIVASELGDEVDIPEELL